MDVFITWLAATPVAAGPAGDAVWFRRSDKEAFWARLSFGVVALGTLLVLLTFRDYGVTWDEDVHNWYGNFVLDYYLSLFDDRSALHWCDLYNYGAVFDTIAAEKDVDGFHPINVGKLMLGDASGFQPCTPAGIRELLVRSQVQISGAEVVILGRGNIVGKPMAAMLCQKEKHANATVTICHGSTRDIAGHCRRADILIAAIGVAEFVKAGMVKAGAVVIDVGVNRISDPSARSGSRRHGVRDDEPAARRRAARHGGGGGRARLAAGGQDGDRR